MTVRTFALAAVVALAVAACARATYEAPDADVTDVDAAIDAAIDANVDAPGSQCSRQPCSILPQCGCDDPARPVCDLDLNNLATAGTECRADNFGGTESTVCTMRTTCAAEHVCVGGRCSRYCDDDNDCAGAGGLCVTQLVFGNPPQDIEGAKVCSTDCVPTSTTNATCPATWACHIYREAAGDQRFFTNCEPAPTSGGTVGTACTRHDQCRPGLECVTFGTTSSCRPSCICPGGNCAAGSCPAGTGSCRSYVDAATIGPITYGACN